MSNTIIFFSVGNPGPMNRHSVGHLILKHLIEAFGASQLVKKGKYSFTKLENVFFVKSNSYMNESGALLKTFLSTERVGNSTIIILYDDFELNFPKVRIQNFKKNESHNGIKSVQKALLSLPNTVYKLGVGIGPKPQGALKDTMAAFVLADFTFSQKQFMVEALHATEEYASAIIDKDGEIGDCNKLNSRISKVLEA